MRLAPAPAPRRPRRGRESPTPELEIPIGLLAEITHRCPLQCPYCSNPVALERPKGELSGSGMGARLRRGGGARHRAGRTFPAASRWCGPTWPRSCARARAAGLYVNLITAAVGLTAEKADALVEAGVEHVQISLQDATSEGCNRITNYKRAFEKKLEAARLVTERGLPLTINAVVHRQNLDRIEEMIALAEALGAHRLEVAHTQYYGWAFLNRAALMPEPRQVEAATRAVTAARERLRGQAAHRLRRAGLLRANTRSPAWADGAGSSSRSRRPGSVLPCHAAASIPGLVFDNVREQSLGWIWRRSDAFNRFRGKSWMREPCRSCPRADEDFGGCRCQAMLLDRRRRKHRSGLQPLAAPCAGRASWPTAGRARAAPDFVYRRYQ